MIGLCIARNEAPYERHPRMGVEPEELFHGKMHRAGQFDDHQSAAGAQDAVHFAQAAIEILEVAHTIRDS